MTTFCRLAEQMAKGIGAALGGGLAGITEQLDEYGRQLDEEEAASGADSGDKKDFFASRSEKMQAAMEKDLLEDDPGDLAGWFAR